MFVEKMSIVKMFQKHVDGKYVSAICQSKKCSNNISIQIILQQHVDMSNVVGMLLVNKCGRNRFLGQILK